MKYFKKSFFLIIILLITKNVCSTEINFSIRVNNIEKELMGIIPKSKIPGISIIIVNDSNNYFYNYGYSDLKEKSPVTSNTLFELASCSKSFTALGVLKLNRENKLNLNDPVSKYIPWFTSYYKKKPEEIRIKHLLYHTSGISRNTLKYIKPDTSSKALENTIKRLSGIELKSMPGKSFEYASINYDILGFIIEKVSNSAYEQYMQENIFKPLGLNSTFVISKSNALEKTEGYKISFYKPGEYKAPVYKGNNPAGYIHSNAYDMAEWLKIQLGIVKTPFDSLIKMSHLRDETVPPRKNNLNAYAMGWNVSLNGDDIIWHDGLNPNFTSYTAFCPSKKTGIVLLANSNSDYTRLIGDYLIKKITGNEVTFDKNDVIDNDKIFSILSIISAILLISIIFYIITIIAGILVQKRKKQALPMKRKIVLFSSLFLTFPFLYGIYIIPKALAGFDWPDLIVWGPSSLYIFAILSSAIIISGYFSFLLSSLFPLSNIYKNSAPYLIALSLFSGVSNMFIIIFITSAINSEPDLKYTLFYFSLIFLVYIGGRKIVQSRLIRYTMNIIYELRIKLINKIFSTPYQEFEKIEAGRIYSTLNDDTVRMGDTANIFVAIITSIITILGGFVYLATLAFWATIITIGVVIAISTTYYIASRSTAPDFEKARDTQNIFMNLIRGMTEGFKELNIHHKKKELYKNDVEDTTNKYRQKLTDARIKFVNAFLLGESLLIIVLAIVAYAFPHLFPNIQKNMLLSFIIVLLYMIGPFNVILNSIPNLMQIKVSWNRINLFLKELPEYKSIKITEKHEVINDIKNIKVQDLTFTYKNNNNDQSHFKVGPINFEVKSGEIMFIIGGNGSGKTTLLKLLTGLYNSDFGIIKINDNEIPANRLGEYYSVIFNPHYLFEKLYGINIANKTNEVYSYLELLNLKEKVNITDGCFNTINLSTGQRKRLALFLSHFESKPIYIFDEWAADQDPEYKKFFYDNLLINMKKEGKIIIAITHDDNYYNVADKILKLERGNVEYIKTNPAPALS